MIYGLSRLKILVNKLENSNSNCFLACSNMATFTDDHKKSFAPYFNKNYKLPKDPFSEFLNGKSIICSPTVLLKTEKLKGIGGYNNQYFAEDLTMDKNFIKI